MNQIERTERRPSAAAFSPSLRDPAGQLFEFDGRIVRVVHRAALPLLDAALGSLAIRRLIKGGKVVETVKLDSEQARILLPEIGPGLFFPESEVGCLLEHKKIPFTAYPFEWAPEMLHHAGALTIELAQNLLPETMGIKDATPYNVLFEGPRAVFVDFLSFEKRQPLDPTWRADAQFATSFLNPLLVNKHFGIPLDTLLLNRRNGISPKEVYSICGIFRRWTPPFLGLATLPTLLSSRDRATDPKMYAPRLTGSAEKASFILDALFRRDARALKASTPPPNRSSFWTGYMESGFPHTPAQLAQKEAFLERVLKQQAPRRLLDVGCNTGHFSKIAAKAGAMVVAIDSDPVAVGRAWKMALAEQLDILPLVVNLGSPSPAVGWRNRECRSFIDRGREHFDTVLMFAVMHHLIISDGIPLREILSVAAQLTRGTLVIEFVGTNDPVFQRMARGRDYSYLTEEYFERQLQPLFQVVGKEKAVGGERCLYLLRKKPSHG